MTIQYDWNDAKRALTIYSDAPVERLPNFTAENNLATTYPLMEYVYIDESVSIDADAGKYAFYNAQKLMVLEVRCVTDMIPNSLCNRCSSLTKVMFASPLREVGTRSFYMTALEDWSPFMDLQIAGVEAFVGARFQKITAPRLDLIATSAFRECASLVMIDLPAVRQILDEAFMETALENVTFGSNLTTIGNHAFTDTPINWVEFVTSEPPAVASDAFTNCPWGGRGIPGVEGAIFVPSGTENDYKTKFPPNLAALIAIMPEPGGVGLWQKISGHWTLVLKDYGEDIEELQTMGHQLYNDVGALNQQVQLLANTKQDTMYPGFGITISGGNTISANVRWTDLGGHPRDNYDLLDMFNQKQNNLHAGTGILLIDNTISASVTWGTIQGDINLQADLQLLMANKQNKAYVGTNVPDPAIGNDGDIFVRYVE